MLAADHNAALALTVAVAERPVGVEGESQAVGDRGQLIGPHRGGMSGQRAFGVLPVVEWHVYRQVVQEPGDDRDVGVVHGAGAPVWGDVLQERGQRCSGKGGALAHQGGGVDAPLGFAGGDAESVGDHLFGRPAHPVGAFLGQLRKHVRILSTPTDKAGRVCDHRNHSGRRKFSCDPGGERVRLLVELRILLGGKDVHHRQTAGPGNAGRWAWRRRPGRAFCGTSVSPQSN